MNKIELILEGSSIVCGDSDPLTSSKYYTWTSLTKCMDGTVLCCAREGSGKNSSDGRIKMYRSDDKGKSWTEGVSPAKKDSTKNPEYEYRVCNITETGNIELTAIYLKINRGDTAKKLFDPIDDGILPAEMVIVKSYDRGKTWSSPKSMDLIVPGYDGVVMADDGCVVLPDGGMLVPAETWKKPGQDFIRGYTQQARVFISRDSGETWTESYVNAIDSEGSNCFYDQRLCFVEEGILTSLMWTHDYKKHIDLNMHVVYSYDYGKTWTNPIDTGLSAQISCPVDLGDGILMTVYNCRKGVQGVKAVLSYDSGKTWDMDGEIFLWRLGLVHAESENKEKKITYDDISGYLFGHPDVIRLSNDEFLAAHYLSNSKHTYIKSYIIRIK